MIIKQNKKYIFIYNYVFGYMIDKHGQEKNNNIV